MPDRARLTRRFPAQMSEQGYRRLRSFAEHSGLSEADALSFVFENLNGIVDEVALSHRLVAYKTRHTAKESSDT